MSQSHHNQNPPPKATTFLDLVWQYKFYLAFYAICISFLSFALLYLIGGVPEELRVLDAVQPTPPTVTTVTSAISATSTASTPSASASKKPVTSKPLPASGNVPFSIGPDYPLRVIIDKAGIDTTISNPTSSDNTILNNALLKGAVRYPGSGTLGHGNMFIFGHNTGIKVVNNQAYKAFNNLKNLEVGDTVRVQSIDAEYNYKITSVKLLDSLQAWVTFSNDKNMLTLSTCDVFGQKQDRYVVEATFIKSISLQ